MRTHRVYIPDLVAGEYKLHGEEAHHLIRVLRVKEGSSVLAFNGQGLEADAVINKLDKADLLLSIAEPKVSLIESELNVSLAIALLKGDKLSDVVRAATELGVNQIQLFTSHYGDVPSLSKNKLERLRKIIKEAAKQSGRSVIPELKDAVSLKDLVLAEHSLVAHPYKEKTLSDFAYAVTSDVMIITGPEGGLSKDEVIMLENKGATAIKFGKRILRAETAPIALLGALFLPRAL